MYCNGSNEHYIDIACPYGKTNSPLEFCPPVRLLAVSAAARYAKEYNCTKPVLGTHVDDIFGGFPHSLSYEKAFRFREYLCKVGKSLTVEFNTKVEKTPLPARRQVILGCLWDSVSARVRTSIKKRSKYLKRIHHKIESSTTTVEDL